MAGERASWAVGAGSYLGTPEDLVRFGFALMGGTAPWTWRDSAFAGVPLRLTGLARMPGSTWSGSFGLALDARCYLDWVVSVGVVPVSAGAPLPVPGLVVRSPRAFIAASVEAQSIPPFLTHPSVRAALEPSLQIMLSAAVALGFPALLVSSAAGPVCTPGSALRVVSVLGPAYPAAPLSACPVGWAAAEESPRS